MEPNDHLAGVAAIIDVEVDQALSADAYGNVGFAVLATPALVGLVERAAMQALQGRLGPGQRTVGSRVDVEHLAPTPVGEQIQVTVTVSSVHGARLAFDVSAADRAGPIMRGHHDRFIVDGERFLQRLGMRELS